MRGALLGLSAAARGLGFALLAIAMVIAVLHVHAQTSRVETRHENSPAAGDPLVDELKRCQLIASKAKDDPASEALWAENRRRFFSDTPAPAAQSAGSTR